MGYFPHPSIIMGKLSTRKDADPNSGRTKRRAKRAFKGSRPNRRADKRHAQAMSAHDTNVRMDKKDGGKGFTAPGSQERW